MTIPERVHSAQGRILVVDDDARMREEVLSGLRTSGYEVEGVEDGLEALRHLQHGRFDVVLTDLQMPRLDGLALLREIRGKGPAPAVIIQTTLLDSSLEVVLRRAGASCVLMKGGPLVLLARSVEQAYQASRKRDPGLSLPPIPREGSSTHKEE